MTVTYPEAWIDGRGRGAAVRAGPARPPRAPALDYGLATLRERLAAGDVRKATLFAAAFLTAPISSARWLARLDALRARLDLDVLPFDLASKLYRPFLSRRLGRAQRLSLLASHYDIVTRAFGRGFVRAMLAGRAAPLAELTGAGGERYVVDVLRTRQFKDEGELILSIYARSRPDKRLGNLVVTVGDVGDGRTALWIGGVQGVCGAKPLIDRATADLGGLRPRAILMEAAWALLAALRYAGTPVRALTAVGDQANIARGRHAADYDAFWRDLGGKPVADGFFTLPPAAPRMGEGLGPGQTIGPKRARKWAVRLDARRQLTATFARMVAG